LSGFFFVLFAYHRFWPLLHAGFGSFFASLVSLFGFLSLTLFYGFLAQGAIPFVLFSTSLLLLCFWFAVLQVFCPLGVFISFGVSFLHICPFSFSYFRLFVS